MDNANDSHRLPTITTIHPPQQSEFFKALQAMHTELMTFNVEPFWMAEDLAASIEEIAALAQELN